MEEELLLSQELLLLALQQRVDQLEAVADLEVVAAVKAAAVADLAVKEAPEEKAEAKAERVEALEAKEVRVENAAVAAEEDVSEY
jgi:hypothetical protein